MPSNSVGGIAFDANGTLWVTTSEVPSALVSFEGTTWNSYEVPKPTGPAGQFAALVGPVAVDLDGSKWVGYNTGGGAARFDGSAWTNYYCSSATGAGCAAPFMVGEIVVDRRGTKWYPSSGSGLMSFDGTTSFIYTTTNSGLPLNTVRAVAVDSANVLWIATPGGGVAKFDGVTWQTFNSANSGLPTNEVLAAAVGVGGLKWFGTSQGLTSFDGARWTSYTVPPPRRKHKSARSQRTRRGECGLPRIAASIDSTARVWQRWIPLSDRTVGASRPGA